MTDDHSVSAAYKETRAGREFSEEPAPNAGRGGQYKSRAKTRIAPKPSPITLPLIQTRKRASLGIKPRGGPAKPDPVQVLSAQSSRPAPYIGLRGFKKKTTAKKRGPTQIKPGTSGVQGRVGPRGTCNSTTAGRGGSLSETSAGLGTLCASSLSLPPRKVRSAQAFCVNGRVTSEGIVVPPRSVLAWICLV